MIKISPFRILAVLATTVISLTFLSLVFNLYSYGMPSGKIVEKLTHLFNVDAEKNIPTWYSSFALSICALILWIISIIKKRNRDTFHLHWTGLSGLFLFLSLDEIVGIHELPVGPMLKMFDLGGFFYFGWVIPASFAVLIFISTYFRFVINLPAQTSLLFCLSGFIFITGAIGVEMISGFIADVNGGFEVEYWNTVPYILTVAIEELFEMTGVVLFIYALILYLKKLLGAGQYFSISFEQERKN